MQGEFDDAAEALPDGHLPPASGDPGLDPSGLPQDDFPDEAVDLDAGEGDRGLDDHDDGDLGDPQDAQTEGPLQEALARLMRDAGLQALIGGSFRVRSGGPAAFGDALAAGRDINITQAITQGVRPHSGAVSSGQLDSLRSAWVRVPSLDALQNRLEHHRVQVLCGAEGSGRFAVAARALDGLAEMVDRLDPDVAPWDLHSGHLKQRHGYIVDVTTAEWAGDLTPNRLASVDTDLEAAKAYLVLLVDNRTPLDGNAFADYLVHHQPPAPEQVLKAHLDSLLGLGADGVIAQLYGQSVTSTHADDETGGRQDRVTIGDAVAEESRHSPGPGRVVDLAHDLVYAVLDGLPPEEVLARLRSRLRDEVRAWFLERGPGVAAGTRPARSARTPWDPAFLISCAVLPGLPVGLVTAAADRLSALLRAVEAPGDPPSRPVFRDLESACRQYVRVTDTTGSRLGSSGMGWGRVVSLRSPKLPDVTLDVVWHHYDAAREPLLEWLEELVAGSDPMARDRAAQAVGKLATYSFAELDQRVIRRWAGSERVAERRAAAVALEVVAADGRFAAQARRRVRRWSRGGAAQRHTAVLAYGTYLGAIFPDDALRDLGRLAEEPRYARDESVARSLVAVLTHLPPEHALVKLAGWAADGRPALRLHAARCLVRLGRLPANPPEGDSWPALLAAVSRDPALWPPLVELWRLALTTTRTAGPAWGLLRRWVRQSDDEPALGGPLGLLAMGLREEPALGDRARFHLWLWRHQATRPSPTLDQLRSHLT